MTAKQLHELIVTQEYPLTDLASMARNLPDAEREALANTLNEECQDCQEAFLKDGLDIKPNSCGWCKYGRILHQVLDKGTNWEKVNWTEAQFEDLYHG